VPEPANVTQFTSTNLTPEFRRPPGVGYAYHIARSGIFLASPHAATHATAGKWRRYVELLYNVFTD
jgi:hypothetical protein